MTCELVHASYSLPEWQAVKRTFFAPWWGIKQLGISFGSIFLLFSQESRLGTTFLAAKGNPWSQPLNDSPGYAVVMQQVQLL